MRLRHTAVALPFLAAAALAARTDLGEVLIFAQPPFSNVTVIGLAGEGSMTIAAGTEETLPAVALGGLATGSGTLTVTGSGSKLTTVGDAATRANAVGVGVTGTGTVQVLDGGELELDGTGNLPGDLAPGFAAGVEAGSVGSVTVSGPGSLIEIRNGDADAAGVAVGLAGQGSLDLLAGAELRIDTGTGESSGLTVGNSVGSNGMLTASGADTAIELSGEGRGLTVGNAGIGVLELSDGAELTGAQVAFLGLEASGDGTLRVESGAQIEVAGTNPQLGYGGALNVGLAGSGRLEVAGGSVVFDNQDGVPHGIELGGSLGCGGPCPLTGGSGAVAVGAGGSVEVRGPLGGATVGADGAGTLEVAAGGSFVIEDPDGQSGVSVGASADSTGSVLVTGAGSLVDAGVGLLAGVDLALADAGSATLTVADGGILQADTVTLGSGAVLRGDGSVTGLVANLRGRVAPGLSTGTLSLAGALQSTGTLHVEIAGTEAGSFDVLQTSGALQLLGGGVELDFLGGFLPTSGDELVIGTSPAGVSVDDAVAASYRGAAPGLDFEVVADGNELVFRALSDAAGFGRCHAAQLRAFAKLCKKLLGCHASYAKKSARDLLGEKRDACLASAAASFEKTWQKAADQAARKGDLCGSDAAAAEADDGLSEDVASLVAEISTGWTPGASRDDDALRSALLAQSGGFCGGLLSAESAQARKRDDARRAAARDRAAQKFLAGAGKALDKAAQKGVAYAGPAPAAISDAVSAAEFDAASTAAGIPGDGVN
jgi:T5SS/PEP-CTERM-associated repeat protein